MASRVDAVFAEDDKLYIYWAALEEVQPIDFLGTQDRRGLREVASQCINELDVSSGKQVVGSSRSQVVQV